MAYHAVGGERVPETFVILTLELSAWNQGMKKDLYENERRLCFRANDQSHDNPVLVLSFLHPPRLGSTFVLGSDKETCDVHLGRPGSYTSANHLRFGFDEQGRVIMQDTSLLGTRVTYDDQPGQHRRGTLAQPYTWILPPGYEITVDMGQSRGSHQFIVHVPDHTAHMDQYRAELASYRTTCSSRLPLLDGINLARAIPQTGGDLTPASEDATLNASSPGAAALHPLILDSEDEQLVQEPAYVSGAVLGQGGNGVVSEFYCVRTWTKYAGKRVFYDSLLDKEMSMLRKLSHNHIVQYRGLFEQRFDERYIIMDLCTGGALYGKDLRPDQVLRVLQQSLDALVYLHDRSIIHRDLQPANILFRSQDPIDIALADFGWSKETILSTASQTFGTETYRAPEARYNKQGPSTDIWSLGVVGVEYLVGLPEEYPYESSKDYALRLPVYIADKIPSEPGRRNILNLLKDMLQIRASERPSAADCLQRINGIILNGDSTPTQPQPQPGVAAQQAAAHQTPLAKTTKPLTSSQKTIKGDPAVNKNEPAVDDDDLRQYIHSSAWQSSAKTSNATIRGPTASSSTATPRAGNSRVEAGADKRQQENFVRSGAPPPSSGTRQAGIPRLMQPAPASRKRGPDHLSAEDKEAAQRLLGRVRRR